MDTAFSDFLTVSGGFGTVIGRTEWIKSGPRRHLHVVELVGSQHVKTTGQR